MAGLRAMNEPVLHTLKPLEEDEDEDQSNGGTAGGAAAAAAGASLGKPEASFDSVSDHPAAAPPSAPTPSLAAAAREDAIAKSPAVIGAAATGLARRDSGASTNANVRKDNALGLLPSICPLKISQQVKYTISPP